MLTNRLRKTAALALAVAAAGGSLVLAQGRQQPTFRAAVDFVEVDVIVTDAAGRFVPGLTAADFELTDAGKPQRIETVHEVNIPLERADRETVAEGHGPVAPDIATNEGASEGRIFTLLLDDLHTPGAHSLHVRERAREFVEKYVGTNDLVAVVQVSGGRASTQDYTSNRAMALAAIDTFTGTALRGATLEKLEDMRNRAGSPTQTAAPRDVFARERVNRARNLFGAIEGLSNHLAGVTGRRKALLLFSAGVDMEPEAGIGMADINDVRQRMLDAVGAATRANVHIYAVEASGMSSGLMNAEVELMPFNDLALANNITTEAIAAERRRAIGSLRTLAAETGGAALVETNAFAAGFAAIQRENSAYYLLGYYPETARDGKFHRIDVRVKRPGLTVRARAGYRAEKPGTRPAAASTHPLGDLIDAAVPSGGLPLRVATPSFRSTRDRATVLIAVDLPGEAFHFEPEGGGFVEDMHVVFQALDAGGKPAAGDGHELTMRVSEATRNTIESKGFRLVAPLVLEPGRYRLRLAAASTHAARRGSVFADLVVPDFAKDPLVWSGISLTSADTAAVPTRTADDATAKLIPLMPSAARVFAPSDTLALYAEAYVNDRAAAIVDLTTTIRDEAGRVVFSASEERSAAEFGAAQGAPGSRGFGLRLDIPLQNLRKGRYVLAITARSRASGHFTASREIPFGIS